jgi:hypothetical protein
MKKKLSYFKLSLQEFLQCSHPHLLNDEMFITSRADVAAEKYEQAVINGSNSVEASEQANAILYQGLHFSKHDTLVNILWNEFAEEVPEKEAKTLAIKLLPECEQVFEQYPLSDGFAYEPEYDLLYTELTGAVALYIESHGI